MSSTNKTENLELNSWMETDRPQRNDFNADNLIIDRVLGEHINATEQHLTSTEKTRVSRPVTMIPYAGDGEASQLITLPCVPQAVWVYREDAPCAVYDSIAGCTKAYSAMAVYGGGAMSGITLSGTGVTVYQSTSAADGVKLCLNEADAQYKIVVMR